MTTDAAPLPADLRRWLNSHIRVLADLDVSWARTESKVWRLTTGTATAYVKISPSRESYVRETAAYRHAAAALDRDEAPQLIAADPVLRAILTTALPGTVVRDLPLEPVAELRVHHLAGRLLRRWHDHPEPIGPQARQNVTGTMTAHSREAGACLDDLGGRLTRAQRVLVGEAARELPAMVATLPLVYVHGDYSPRNWVWQPDNAALGLIDFEMADHAPAVQDMVWLFGAVWPARPDLRESFLSGLGRRLTATEHRVLLLLTARLAVSYLSAGLATGQQMLIDRGRNALTALTHGDA